MKNKIKIIGKLLLIGLLTTIVRIIGQLIIPAGQQEVLKPSIFVNNGTMPIAFTIYGIFAYAVIASMFLLVKDSIGGSKVERGLKYSFSCCLVWVVYLLEPLPHVAFIDKFTYPLADGMALLVMGGLAGKLLCTKEKSGCKSKFTFRYFPTVVITVSFVLGRVIQYDVLNIYSSYDHNKIGSIVWAIFTGIILSLVIQWLNDKLIVEKNLNRVIILGTILYGIDLFLFNFFMPLVFDADIPDLLMRTLVDIGCITMGCFSLRKEVNQI